MAEPMVSATDFAKAARVSRMAITRAIQAGRLRAYNEAGRPVSPAFRGRKFLRLEEAKEAFECNRVRLDDWFLAKESEKSGPPPRDLLTARTRTAGLQAELLQVRLAREQGDVIPRAAARAAVAALGMAVRRAHAAIPNWAEEITGAAQTGGIAAVSGLLRAKSAELGLWPRLSTLRMA
jgi:hypothetical protein